jgi:hypothetical protein
VPDDDLSAIFARCVSKWAQDRGLTKINGRNILRELKKALADTPNRRLPSHNSIERWLKQPCLPHSSEDVATFVKAGVELGAHENQIADTLQGRRKKGPASAPSRDRGIWVRIDGTEIEVGIFIRKRVV